MKTCPYCHQSKTGCFRWSIATVVNAIWWIVAYYLWDKNNPTPAITFAAIWSIAACAIVFGAAIANEAKELEDKREA